MHRAPHPLLQLLAYAGLAVGAVIMLLPLAWMVSAAFKPLAEVIQVPPTWIPRTFTLQSFIEVFGQFPFARYLLNSFIVAVCVVISVLLTSSMAGYALARFNFPGRDLLFILILASLMVPFQTRMIPLYQLVTWVDWEILGIVRIRLQDTLLGVMFPWLVDAFGIFLLRQYIRSVPSDIIDAARIDGASEFRIYWQIILPLCRPALAALGIFTLVLNWEEFLWPLIVTSGHAARTLPVGLQSFAEQYAVNTHWQMAGATIAILPLVIAFLLLQRQFIRGIAMTGLKG